MGDNSTPDEEEITLTSLLKSTKKAKPIDKDNINLTPTLLLENGGSSSSSSPIGEDDVNLTDLLPNPLDLERATSIIQIYTKTPEGLEKLCKWAKVIDKRHPVTKVNFLWAMGITGEVTKILIQPAGRQSRNPPCPLETQAIFLLKVMANIVPHGHLFLYELLNAGAIPILLDYIDRHNYEIPNEVLLSAVQILVNLAWKMEGLNKSVAEAINGNLNTRSNLLILVSLALSQITDGTCPTTAPLLLEGALLLVYNFVYNRPSEGPGAITLLGVKEIIKFLDYSYHNPHVESQSPKSLVYIGNIYKDLFMKAPVGEFRYSVIDMMLKTTVWLLDRWLTLLKTSSNAEIIKSIMDLLVAFIRYGNQAQGQLITDSGIIGIFRSLLTHNNDEVCIKAVDLVGAVGNVDQSFAIHAFLLAEPDIVPLIHDIVARVDGPLFPVIELNNITNTHYCNGQFDQQLYQQQQQQGQLDYQEQQQQQQEQLPPPPPLPEFSQDLYYH